MTDLNQIDLQALSTGKKRVWDNFVVAATPLINSVIRASLATWLAVVARSAAVDFARRRRQPTSALDDVPESALAFEDKHVEKLKIPEGLLTERQTLILKCLYDEERDVAEVAQLLKIDAQTVRSTHHKALLRLREHFQEEKPAVEGG